MTHAYGMRGSRLFAGFLLMGTFLSGQIMSPGCRMFLVHAPATEVHGQVAGPAPQHTHAAAETLPQHADHDDTAPVDACGMSVSCSATSLAQPATVLDARTDQHEPSGIWLPVRYADPIVLISTPPPRA